MHYFNSESSILFHLFDYEYNFNAQRIEAYDILAQIKEKSQSEWQIKRSESIFQRSGLPLEVKSNDFVDEELPPMEPQADYMYRPSEKQNSFDNYSGQKDFSSSREEWESYIRSNEPLSESINDDFKDNEYLEFPRFRSDPFQPPMQESFEDEEDLDETAIAEKVRTISK